MGTRIGTMVQPSTGLTQEIYQGWSWPCFCFGSLWYLAKGMWGIGLVWLLLSIVTGSVLHWIGIVVMAAKANEQYREHLGARGYVVPEGVALAPEVGDEDDASNRRRGYVLLAVVVLLLWIGISLTSDRDPSAPSAPATTSP